MACAGCERRRQKLQEMAQKAMAIATKNRNAKKTTEPTPSKRHIVKF